MYSEFSLMGDGADGGWGTSCGTDHYVLGNDDGIVNNVRANGDVQSAGGNQIDLNYDVSGSPNLYPCAVYQVVD